MKKILISLMLGFFLVSNCSAQTIRFEKPIYLNQDQFKLFIVFDSMNSTPSSAVILFSFNVEKFKLLAFGGLCPIPFVSSPSSGVIKMFWENISMNNMYFFFEHIERGCGYFVFDSAESFILDSSGNYLPIVFQDDSICASFLTSDSLDFIIYPNPSSGLFFWKEDGIFSEVEIFNTFGSLIYRFTNVKKTLDLGEVEKGIYFLKFKDDKRVFTRKIIKI